MKKTIETEVIRFVKDASASKEYVTEWEEPIIGFARADDPMFARLKTAVSPTHTLPGDLLKTAGTVIAYFIPFTKALPRKNKTGEYAVTEWAVGYIETNRLIMALNHHLAGVLDRGGYDTVVLPPTHNFDTRRLVSDWSHKHIAYIAGLGQFGVHRLLITDKGCCGRLGSILTTADIEPTPRTETPYCLYTFNGTCRRCVQKCIKKILSPEHFDRRECYARLLENAELHKKYGLADVCGKCSCIVPCSFHNPVGKMLAKKAAG